MATKELLQKQGELVDAVVLADSFLSWIESLNDAAILMIKNDKLHYAKELIDISNYIIGSTSFHTQAKEEMEKFNSMKGTA